MYLGLGLSKAQIIYHVHTRHPQYIFANSFQYLFVLPFFTLSHLVRWSQHLHLLYISVTVDTPLQFFMSNQKTYYYIIVVVKHSSTTPHSTHRLTAAAGNKILGVVGRTRAPPPQRSPPPPGCHVRSCSPNTDSLIRLDRTVG